MKDKMTPKQRLLASLRGEETDRTAWSPNLAYWHDFRVSKGLDKNMYEVMKDMGADPLIRGFDPTKFEYEHIRVYDTVSQKCELKEEVSGKVKTQMISTPVGKLRVEYQLAPDSDTWFLTDHPVKNEKDVDAAIYYFDDMKLVPNFDRYNKAAETIGEDGLIVPMLVPEINVKSGFQSLIEYWLGTMGTVYALMDYPQKIEELLKSIRRVHKEAAEISAQSEAEVFLTWEDTSTTNISPQYYADYILPELNEWSEILEQNGKMYMQHACGHLNDLLPMMAQSKVHGIESISPAPTGNVVMQEARAKLPREKFLIGGIEPVKFMDLSMSKLKNEVVELLNIMKGYPYILANSDSCPPEVEYEKFLMITELVKSGKY